MDYLPYEKVKERSRYLEKAPGSRNADHTIKIYFDGLHESGKSTIFKQMLYASGFRFSKDERKLIRFGLIKAMFLSLDGILNKLMEMKSPVIEKHQAGVELIKSYVKKHIPAGYGQTYEKAKKMKVPEKVKAAAFEIWEEEDTKRAFQICKEEGGKLVLDSFRLFMGKLKENPTLYETFGTKKFLPDQEILCFSSNGPRYGLKSNLHFYSEDNASLATKPVGPNQYYSRPDLRPTRLQYPLKHVDKKGKQSFWTIELQDPGLRKLPANLADKDCLVFTVDISAYDTIVSRSIGIKKTDPAYEKKSILKYSIDIFKAAAKKGHIIACIFTHVDLFFEKYQKMKIPIDVLGDFPDAPVWEDEQDDAIKIALGYFQDIFLRERHEAYALLEGAASNRRNDLFKVFCVNATDISNVQGTLKAMLEQFAGLNIPVNSKKIK